MTIIPDSIISFVELSLFLVFYFAHFRRLFYLFLLCSFTSSPCVCFVFWGRCMHIWNPLCKINTHNTQTPLVFPSLPLPMILSDDRDHPCLFPSFLCRVWYADTAFHAPVCPFCLCLPCFAVSSCTCILPHP